MKYNDPMEEKLKSALASSRVPDEHLNQRIMEEIRGMKYVNVKRTIRPAVLAAVMVFALAITCFAAVKLWTPQEISSKFGYDGLAAAFESDDALLINETVVEDGYEITMMGIISGDALGGEFFADGELREGNTYAVVAIANADGTPMPNQGEEGYEEELSRQFFVSPLIEGLEPWLYNIASMNGGYTENIIDGVRYRLISCDNVEIFADRNMYLCVSEGTFFNSEAYAYDHATGTIGVNADYDGVNALFDLSLDESKADPEAAAEYVKNLWSEE